MPELIARVREAERHRDALRDALSLERDEALRANEKLSDARAEWGKARRLYEAASDAFAKEREHAGLLTAERDKALAALVDLDKAAAAVICAARGAGLLDPRG